MEDRGQDRLPDMYDSKYWSSVRKLAAKQIAKLEKNEHKGRWEDMSPMAAFKRLLDEGAELFEAVNNGYSVEEVWSEAADVANFALMLAETYERNSKHDPAQNFTEKPILMPRPPSFSGNFAQEDDGDPD